MKLPERDGRTSRDSGQPCQRQWTSRIPQVAGEDIIAIGNSRYAHFRRDRRFAQVQVAFTAPEGVDPNPGRELTDRFNELGWTWRMNETGKPWIFQLEKSSLDDPTARGDSRDALHEQFLLIIQEYRQKYGMSPTIGWQRMISGGREGQITERPCSLHDSSVEQSFTLNEKQKQPSAKKETRAGGQGLLDAFASVGAEQFDLTFTDVTGEKVGFRGNRSLQQLRSTMPAILQKAAERQHNVIVRPRSSGAALIQLDDLGESMAARLLPVSFLVLHTSPGNYQTWVAVADSDADFARQLRKGTGADPTASGATRLSGSRNYKPRYAPDFPVVETAHICLGRVVTRDELEALGVVTPCEKMTPAVQRQRYAGLRGWPSYQQCLEHPKAKKKDGRADRSLADFTWCKIAINWGWGVEETADRLMQESGKAKEKGEAYALRTARNAAVVIERRGGRLR